MEPITNKNVALLVQRNQQNTFNRTSLKKMQPRNQHKHKPMDTREAETNTRNRITTTMKSKGKASLPSNHIHNNALLDN